jgi:DNA-binding MarR family transcriptional regulator
MPKRQPPASDEIDLDRLAFDLHSAMLHMMRRVRREDDAFGLSAPRMSALSVVHFGGPRTIGEIARMEQVSAPTMTRLVAGLEADGYVRRQPSPTDGRATVIHPTAKGKRVMEQGRTRRVTFLARQLRSLDPSTLAALVTASTALHSIHESSRET